jgi:hypothetical protein
MALKKTQTTSFGFDIPDAYLRVESVALVSKNNMTFNLKQYVSDKESNPFSQSFYDCSYDINGANPIAQAYEFLKTLPTFDSAIDC